MRIHFFDNGRALASILGFFYHVSLIFSVPWIINVNASEFNNFFYYLKELLSLFRMPLFIFISGYFAIHAVKKYSFIDFRNNRLLRLGLPLISTLYTLVFIMYIYSDVKFKGTASLTDVIEKVIPWSASFTLAHLWFLYIVIIYSFLLYGVVYFVKRITNGKNLNKLKQIFAGLNIYSIDFIFILFSISLSGSLLLLSQFVSVDHALIPLNSLTTFLPYFTLGVLTNLFNSKYMPLLFQPTRKRLGSILVIFLLAIVFLIFTQGILHSIFNVIAKYYSLLIVFYGLHKFFNRTNRFLRYLSDSSYIVYLFHQPIIVIVSFYYLKNINTNSYVSFFFILVASIIITYLADYILIRNTGFGKFLFTGVSPDRNKSVKYKGRAI